MSIRKSLRPRYLFLTVLVPALMTLGADQARACVGCPNDGTNFVGSCTSQEECQRKCENANFTRDVIGSCDGGCCSCLL